jgi:hemerythrin
MPVTMQNDRHDLLVRIDDLCSKLNEAAPDPEIVFLLSEIHASLAAHFQREERRLRRHHDADFTKRKVEHDGLLEEIRTLIERSTGAVGPDFGRSLAMRLRTWLDRYARGRGAEHSLTP